MGRSRARGGRRKDPREKAQSEGIDPHGVMHWVMGAMGVDLRHTDHRDQKRMIAQVFGETRPYLWGVFFWMVLVFFGGGGSVLSQGIFLFGVGLTLLVAPPSRRPTGVVWWGCWLFLALSSAALLPAWTQMGSVLGTVSEVNPGLIQHAFGVQNLGDFGVSWFMTLAGVFWLITVLSWRTHASSNRGALWVLGLGVAGLSLLFFMGITWLEAGTGKTTSFFPGRNQTAIVFAVGTVLGLGMMVTTFTERWLVPTQVALMLTLFAGLALVRIESRGGVLFALVGLAIFFLLSWLFGKNSRRGMKFGIPAVGIGWLLIMLSESRLRERLFPVSDGDGEGEFRAKIWEDTWALIKEHPLGIGLGQFEAWIPQYLDHASVGKSVTFPENDWLWMISEQGWPVLVVVVAAMSVWLLTALRTVGRHRSSGRFLTVSLVAVLLGHSLVDGGWHRAGIYVLGAMLISMTLRETRAARMFLLGEKRVSWMGAFGFRVAGAALGTLGLIWALGTAVNWPVHPDLVEREAKIRITQAVGAREPQSVQEAAQTWQAWRPLNWEVHFATAAGYLRAGGRDEEVAIQGFRLARMLEPNLAVIPFEEGRVWFERGSATRGFAAWRLAIERPSENKGELFNQMLKIGYSESDPDSRRRLVALSEFSPDLRLKIYDRVDDSELARLVVDDLRPGGFGPEFAKSMSRTHFYRVATEIGENRMLALIPDVIEDEQSAWDIQFFARRSGVNPRMLAEWMGTKVTRTVLPRELPSLTTAALERQYASPTDDPVRGLGLAERYLRAQRRADALRVLRMVSQSGTAAGMQAWEWLARLRTEEGQFEEAVYAWGEYLYARAIREIQ